jgi:hypothetical protein
VSGQGQPALSRDSERRQNEQARLEQEAARRERMTAAIARARAAGFTERQAPFAAMAWETFKVTRGEPSVAEVRDRVKAQYPELFNDSNEEG